MSKWTDFRDGLVDSLKFDTVTEDMKQGLTDWLLETAYPLAETAAGKFISQVKSQADSETGWCKVRDMVVLPFVIQGALWLVQSALSKTATATTSEA